MGDTRLLIKERATGKTTGLLYTSEATGYPIVVQCISRIKQIQNMADELNIIIPEPITIEDLKSKRCQRPENVLIDESYSLIGDALDSYLGTHVIAATLSDSIKELDNIRKGKSKRGDDSNG